VTREPTLDQLRAEARYHRDRLALYRARALTGQPTRETRLRELERAADGAQGRLDRALGR
jgi:hypothetical protein